MAIRRGSSESGKKSVYSFKYGYFIIFFQGLSPNQANSSGQRPLMCAKTVDCLVQLVKYGADVNATNRKGRTALMQACINGNVPCIEYLLRQGANPNMTDSGGRSALMLAVRGRHDNVLPCVKLLVQYNANVQHMDKYHVSAFDLTDRNDVKEALLNESLIRASHQANEGLNGTNVNISRINNPMIKDQAQNSNREIIEAFQQLGLTSESPVSDGRTRSYSSDSSISEVTEPTVAISPTIRSTGIFSFFLGRNA